MVLPATAVSAPGKVLLTGGYLVLDRKYTGLVFGLDARIHVHIQSVRTSSGVTLQEFIVRSPQFADANWEYGYHLAPEGGGLVVTQLRASADAELQRNPFVEVALSYALNYIYTLTSAKLEPASITILADRDYYSHKLYSSDKRFSTFLTPLRSTPKTGLGSSAALVTAMTGALLCHYLSQDQFDIESGEGKALLHNLSQAAHCYGQGKVGSGFDVAAAVYGSCLYRRFSPSILQEQGEPGSPGFANSLKSLVEDKDHIWDTETLKEAVNVPEGLRLVMCDVTGGSKTPGMVKQVLAWREAEREVANRIWEALQQNNEQLAQELRRLAQKPSGVVDGKDFYARLSHIIERGRKLAKEMSSHSGVPIEPDTQTQLLDACTGIPGIVGGVVPGAGGYDAVALLAEDREEVTENLQRFLIAWNAKNERAGDNGGAGYVSMLGVKQDMVGIASENPDKYRDFL